jgi:hypothetical protein
MLTAANDFMVRTTECSSPVLSILRLSCASVCIGALSYEWFDRFQGGRNYLVNGRSVNFFTLSDIFDRLFVIFVGLPAYSFLGLGHVGEGYIVKYTVCKGDQNHNLIGCGKL